MHQLEGYLLIPSISTSQWPILILESLFLTPFSWNSLMHYCSNKILKKLGLEQSETTLISNEAENKQHSRDRETL